MAGRTCRRLPTEFSRPRSVTLSLPSQGVDYIRARPAAPRAGPGGLQCLHGSALASLPRCSFLPSPPFPRPSRRKDLPRRRPRRRRDQARGRAQGGSRHRREAGHHAQEGRRCGAQERKTLDGAADIYVQIVTVAPNDAQAWRRLADLWLTIPTTDEDDGSDPLRAGDDRRLYRLSALGHARRTRPTSLVMLANAYGKRDDWRPALNALKLALELHETPELKTTYDELAREIRLPRLQLQRRLRCRVTARLLPVHARALPKRTDFSPFVAVAGQDKPALSVDDQQICVEGLKHGESYAVTLREGLPSTVGENLLKTADFSIYVRDRSPFVRLSGKAYVLPKTGQQGIPLVSVNTDAIKVTIYRIGDRNLIDNVLGGDFERNLYGYTPERHRRAEGREGVDRRARRWRRSSTPTITTAFPINEAVPTLAARRLCACRAARRASPSDEYGERATQWFIVSDLGLTAYSGSDGIHAFVNSLATHRAGRRRRASPDRAQQRGARHQDHRRQRRASPSSLGLSRGEGGLSPALARRLARRRRLRLPQSQAIALRSDRPRRRRARRACRSRRLSCSPSAASIAPARPCM